MSRKKIIIARGGEAQVGYIRGRLTRVEHHFADYDPSRGEVQVQLEQAAASPVETDRDVPGVLQHQVRYVGVRHRFVLVGLAVSAEPDVRLGEYLRREQIT